MDQFLETTITWEGLDMIQRRCSLRREHPLKAEILVEGFWLPHLVAPPAEVLEAAREHIKLELEILTANASQP